MILRAGLIAFLMAALPAGAQSTVDDALAAAEALDNARAILADAADAEDRVAALTNAVLAYEHGLATLRDAQRRIELLHRDRQADFDRESAALSALLAALQSAGKPATSARLLHPDGPLVSVRAAMIMADIAPVLQAQAAQVRATLDQIDALDAANMSARGNLQSGAADLRQARLELTQSLRSRAGPETPPSDLPALDRLAAAGADLQDFALALAETPAATDLTHSFDFAGQRGSLSPPVSGSVLRAYGAEDAAGVARPGVIIATRAGALITTPMPATLRYRGALGGYGNVMILEAGTGYLLILTGMEQALGAPGDVLELGAPIGLMGETLPDSGRDANERGETLTETLYVETREDGRTVDPATWFALDKER